MVELQPSQADLREFDSHHLLHIESRSLKKDFFVARLYLTVLWFA